ncbi:MAG: MFS transporter [Thermoplasmata archaeon]|nr:MFS transporter [Thermoplasmata archaeon]
MAERRAETGEVAPDPNGTTVVRLSELTGILVFVGIFLAILMGAMDGLVVATVLPTISTDLHQSDGVTFVVSAYLISSTISIPMFARLSDISSRRNVFLLGIGIFIVGSALSGLSQNLTELIIFRGMQGFGGGGVFPVAIAMATVLYPPETRAKVTGLLTGSAGLAIVLGPLVGSYIVSVTTWRWVFYINLPFGILAALVLLVAVGPLRPATRGSFDVPGAALLSGWVAALMFALVQVANSGWAWSDPRVVALLGAAALLLALFLWWELHTKEPLLPLRLLRHRVIASSSGTMLFTGVVFSALIAFLSLVVGTVLLHNGPNSESDVRDIIYFLAVPLILGAALSGQILSRLSYRNVVAPGLFVAAVAGFFLAQLSTSTPLWIFEFGFLPVGGLALPLIPLGFGLGLSLAGTTIAVQNEAPPAEVGAAIGLTRFFQSLGGAIGLSLLTVFLTERSQSLTAGATAENAITTGLLAAYNEVFLLLAAAIVIGFAFALFLVGRVPLGRAKPSEAPPTPPPETRDVLASSLEPESEG